MGRVITVAELRKRYVEFFESKGHKPFASGSLIPYDVTGKLDESLLFNGAGMIQFKPYFLGTAQPEHKRLVTVQKCLRTGDIEEVGDDSHLTFFEMLGNFSFGDYFKREAIDLSWEFLTSELWLNLEPHRLAFTVFQEDSEAETQWHHHLNQLGINGVGRVFRLGEESNYWPANSFTFGPPGPCGPNSEMFYWVPQNEPAPDPATYQVHNFLADEKAGKWLEIWNDVFISFDWKGKLKDPSKPALGYQKSGLDNLPFPSIDTGMGLERTAAVLSGLNSVFQTDAFEQILAAIEFLTPQEVDFSHADAIRAKRIIADHVRAMTVAIADGVLPSNTGRGYVLRRLIRRAVLQGFKTLKMKEGFLPFLSEAAMGVAPKPHGSSSDSAPYCYQNESKRVGFTHLSSLGNAYDEILDSQATLLQVLKNEEHLFRRTLEHGITKLEGLLAGPPNTLSGEEAFKLYDTFGFPLEITLEVASEAGWGVDIDGFEETMKRAQERSRAGQERDTVYGNVGAQSRPATVFVGYQEKEEDSLVVDIETTDAGKAILLDKTPFYAASGGQIGDKGTLSKTAPDGKTHVIDVLDTTKSAGTYFHQVEAGADLQVGDRVVARIDERLRAKIQRNHTATHLLHAALHKVVGRHATQAGSYVGPDRLRFDFTHSAPVGSGELKEIEAIVTTKILENLDVITYADLPISEAKKRGAMALFGEKYGDKVRMVEIGEFSRELCGGTHVRSTGEIGLFHIVSEGSASSGIRRIEAVTGESALEWIHETDLRLRNAAELLRTQPKDVVASIERLLAAQKELKKQIESLRHTSPKSATSFEIGSIKVLVDEANYENGTDIKSAVDGLVDGQPMAVGIATAISDGKILFAVKVGAEAIKLGVSAGSVVKAMAQATGGGGGGNPSFATAGGREPNNRPIAIEAGIQEIQKSIGA